MRSRPVVWLVAGGLVICLLLAGFVSFYASAAPDGLERVAADHGLLDHAADSAVAGSPLADYGVAGVSDERVSVGLAGVAGVAITAAAGFGLFGLLSYRRKPATGQPPAGTAA